MPIPFHNNLAILFLLISFSSLISSADLPNYNDIVSQDASENNVNSPPNYDKCNEIHIEQLIRNYRWDTPIEIAKSLNKILNSTEYSPSFATLLINMLNRMNINLNIYEFGQCAIHFAALMDRDYTLNYADRSLEGYVNVIDFLIKYAKCDVNSKDENGNTALHIVIGGEAIRTLIRNGADINARNNNLKTALHEAAPGYAYKIELLLGAGAIPNLKDKDRQTPADIASSHRYITLAALIRSYYPPCCIIL